MLAAFKQPSVNPKELNICKNILSGTRTKACESLKKTISLKLTADNGSRKVKEQYQSSECNIRFLDAMMISIYPNNMAPKETFLFQNMK